MLRFSILNPERTFKFCVFYFVYLWLMFLRFISSEFFNYFCNLYVMYKGTMINLFIFSYFITRILNKCLVWKCLSNALTILFCQVERWNTRGDLLQQRRSRMIYVIHYILLDRATFVFGKETAPESERSIGIDLGSLNVPVNAFHVSKPSKILLWFSWMRDKSI